ncbi:hypothetical protein GmHk_15G044211 [Glycine max]|nr:hypothetical protein GmHk_15G044211 [Glycine max]
MSELTNEEHKQCCEMAKIMLKVTVPLDTILNTVNVKDQIYGEVSRSFVVRWKDDENFHTVVYNQDLDKPIIVAEWTTLKDFYHLTGDHQVSLTHYVSNFVTFKVYPTPHKVTCNSLDVPNTMYYFLKDKGWTHLHLEDVVECRLVFNHLRKIVKIGAGWKYFCESPSKLA